MKKLNVLFILLLMTMTASAQKYSDSTWIVGEGHVGKIQINMDERKLNTLFKESQIKAVKKGSDEDTYSEISITLTGETKPGIMMQTMCIGDCIIAKIRLTSPLYKTIKGIGVGSSIADLKKVYSIGRVSQGDEGLMVYIDEIPQLAFVVDAPGVKAGPNGLNGAQLPDDAKIKMIYMY
jgi:hypothetical protein